MDKSPSALRYVPQLDTLRAFAVFMVLIHHFPGPFPEGISYGAFGVQLFFVLSGYLITRILLVGRRQTGEDGRLAGIRIFYIRRFLRIFPVFYFILFLTALLDIVPVRETFFWHFFYVSNFYFARLGDWHGSVSHFWTLAVEEQFYLVWPFVMFFTPAKLLPKMILAFILAGPVFRFLGAVSGMNEIALITLPLSNVDALGLGALLGYLSLTHERYVELGSRLARWGLWAGLPVYALDFFLRKAYLLRLPVLTGVAKTGLSLFFVGVIFHVSRGVKGPVGRVLSFGPLVYMGRLSYGLYIYHNFTPILMHAIARSFGLETPLPKMAEFGANLFVLAIVAMLSWHLFEKPVNDLKRHWEMGRS